MEAETGQNEHTESNKEMFAFGETSVDGCQCPAAKADLLDSNININSMGHLFLYDKILQEMTSEDKGTVPEPVARDVWAQTINKIKRSNNYESRHLSHSREVATQLNWDMSEYDSTE